MSLPTYIKEKFNRYNSNRCNPQALKLGNELQQGMQIAMEAIFTSDFFTINNLNCLCRKQSATSEKDCNDFFNITFIRNGYFTFNSFPKTIDACNSYLFLKKPGCEYTVTQKTERPFSCTIFNFSDVFLSTLKEEYNLNKFSFFKKDSIFALQLIVTPELEFLHHIIWQKLHQANPSKLFIDCMVVELVDSIFRGFTGSLVPNELNEKLKLNHWVTVEKAKM